MGNNTIILYITSSSKYLMSTYDVLNTTMTPWSLIMDLKIFSLVAEGKVNKLL